MPKNDVDTIEEWLKKNVITEDTLKLKTDRRDPENASISIDIDWSDIASSLYDDVIIGMLERAKELGIEEEQERSS